MLGLQLLLKTMLSHFFTSKGFVSISHQNSKLYKLNFINLHCHW